MKKLYKDQVLGIIFVVIALVFTYLTTQLAESTLQGDPGPKIFPFVACFLMGASGIAMIVAPSKKEGKKFLGKEEWKRLFTLYGVYVLYFVLLWVVGYRIAVPLVLLILSTLFSRGTKTGWIKILIYTVGVSAALYVLYIIVMETRLPMGILFGGK